MVNISGELSQWQLVGGFVGGGGGCGGEVIYIFRDNKGMGEKVAQQKFDDRIDFIWVRFKGGD